MIFKSNFKTIFLLSLFFTIVIFFLKNYIFVEKIDVIEEEKHIDTTAQEEIDLYVGDKKIIKEKKEEVVLEKYVEKVKKEIDKDERNIFFSYIPAIFKNKTKNITSIIKGSIMNFYFENKVRDITIELHEKLVDVRGKMKNKTIKLFGPENMGKEETLAVFIHELGHYVDLYYFGNNEIRDTSEYFYDISWDSTRVMKKGQTTTDFVSGYSMTNKYEDFAESFIYYVLHNKDFSEKANKNSKLKQKYLFFRKYLFKNDEFYLSNFGENKNIKNYYRDITKIKINLEKFLQYLKDSI